jgi:hypothetical protein
MSEEERIDATQPTDEPLDAGEVVAEETYAADAIDAVVSGEGLSEEQALADAREDRFRARAAWSLVDRPLFAFLFANCLFFAAALGSWTTRIPDVKPGKDQTWAELAAQHALSEVWGLETIRGVLIFALAIYGFWTAVFNIWHRQMKLWPYLLNALLAEWVGIQMILGNISGPTADAMKKALDAKASPTLMDSILYRLGVVPPAAWALVFGGIIVFVVLIRGIMEGGKKVKARAAEAGGAPDADGGRRRRR